MPLVERQEVNYGDFASVLPGAGIALSGSRTAVRRAYADDGGVAMAAGSYRSFIGRFLMSTATSADVSVNGLQGHLKIGATYSGPGNKAGVWGYAEAVAGKTVGPFHGAICAMVDLPATAIIASGAILAAFRAYSNTLAGTHTGVAAIVDIQNPGAGLWDVFLNLGSATGIVADTGAGGATSKYLKVLIGGVAYSILVKSDA